jgi:hypothetical protein
MDIAYDWRFGEPAERLFVQMQLERQGAKVFDARLTMTRREISGHNLAHALVRFPFMAFGVLGAIYWQAALLKIKRMPFFEHPLIGGDRPR